jgi:hypothetical protein
VPFWDQWAKEGDDLFPAWFERHELWRSLFATHNEHRIAPTLALNLGLVVASGQWDGRVQTVLSGALHAAVLAGLFLWFARRASLAWVAAAGALFVLIGGSAIAWENALSGFQSQFYFLAAFSLLAIGGLLTQPAFSWRWWGGAAAGACALVSMGSGLLAPAAIFFVAALRLIRAREQARRDAIATLLACVALLGVGGWLHRSFPAHESLHAHGVFQLVRYALHCLAWPLPAHAWLALLLWLPWGILFAQRLWRAFSRASAPAVNETAIDFVLAAGVWVLAQTIAVAYARGGGGDLPASRYGDVFGLGLAVSFCAWVFVTTPGRRSVAIAAVWWLGAMSCLVVAARETWATSLPTKKADHTAYERNVQQFVLTDDFETFRQEILPFPIADWLARVLRRPVVREILPASIRAPLRLDGFSEEAGAPVPPLPHRRIRAISGPGEWRSGPLPPGKGWWKFEVAGALGTEGTSLQIVAAADGRVLATVAPTRLARESWRAAYVPAPREPARLVARNPSATSWFAFSEPVEMSSLSYRTWRLAKQGWLLASLAGGAALVLTLATAMGARIRSPGLAA